ncbi:hypothetical protein C8Q80DRAFT_685191 [Daedaleopsis nitida]|nr:hypothetical protein C8Q80DRAFT_685191 [Daedaleopsis nitida]
MRPWLVHTTHLRLQMLPFYDDTSGGDGSSVLLFVHELAGHLPHLEDLSLSNWMPPPAPHPTTFRMFSTFPALSSLALHRCQFPSLSAFCRMLSALPRLHTLDLVDVSWPLSQHTTQLNGRCGRSSIVTISYGITQKSDRFPEFGDLFEWLATTPTRDSIKCVWGPLASQSKPWPDSVIRFLREAAGRLTSLQAPFKSGFSRLPVAKMVELRELKLGIDIEDGDSSGWGDIVAALSLPRGLRHLERLCFTGVKARVVFDILVISTKPLNKHFVVVCLEMNDEMDRLGPVFSGDMLTGFVEVAFELAVEVSRANRDAKDRWDRDSDWRSDKNKIGRHKFKRDTFRFEEEVDEWGLADGKRDAFRLSNLQEAKLARCFGLKIQEMFPELYSRGVLQVRILAR